MADLIREIVIDASPATIYEFLTIPEKHVEWNGTSAELDPWPGGIYRVLAGGVHQAAGEYVEVVPDEKVVFTFGWDQPDHPIPPGSTQVEIRLIPEGDKTRVPPGAQRSPRRCSLRPHRAGITISGVSPLSPPVAASAPTQHRARPSRGSKLSGFP